MCKSNTFIINIVMWRVLSFLGFLGLGHTVKPLLSTHLSDLPKCPLNTGKNCTMFVNDQHSTVTLYFDEVACC